MIGGMARPFLPLLRPVVAGLAQALQVGRIPEQPLISAMRLDVVGNEIRTIGDARAAGAGEERSYDALPPQPLPRCGLVPLAPGINLIAHAGLPLRLRHALLQRTNPRGQLLEPCHYVPALALLNANATAQRASAHRARHIACATSSTRVGFHRKQRLQSVSNEISARETGP